ncbi:MAG: hypothetical protein FWF36_05020 [Propionibacteriaceae bacterium]|nr:hypothetical protein [Propionibacteriaceae bacterium]
MRGIHIANERKRDAEVGFESQPPRRTVSMVMPDGEAATTVKYVKTTADIDRLTADYGDLGGVAQALVDGDPEVDLELVGRPIKATHKIYLTPDGQPAYRVTMTQIVYNPDGTERERRDLSKAESNINAEAAINWSGRKFPKADAVRRFVFTRSYQLRHTSGLSYDFLYDMAKTLQDEDVLMFVGSGAKGQGPLILTTGGEPYRGFLEGRVAGDRYCLTLHLTNIELKSLPKSEA